MFGIFQSIGSILRGNHVIAANAGSYSNTYQHIDATHALRCATVWNSIDIVSTGISEVEFSAPDDKKLNDILHHPNTWQSSVDWLYSLAFDQLLYGFALNHIYPNNANPQYIAPYNPEQVRIEVNQTTREPTYRVLGLGSNTNGMMLSNREILRIRDSGSNMVRGVRRIDALALRINALIHADLLINNVFDKGIALSYVAKSPKPMSAEAMTEWLTQLTAAFGAAGSARGGVAVMDDGKDLTTIDGLKPSDAELRQLRLDLIREITSGFGIPPFLGGGDSDTKYNNTSARIQAMHRGAFSPMIKKIKTALQFTFRTEIKADDSVLLKGDFASQVANAATLVTSGIWTPNEAREGFFDKPEIEGGDVLRVSANPTDNSTDRRGEMPTDDGILDGDKKKQPSLSVV